MGEELHPQAGDTLPGGSRLTTRYGGRDGWEIWSTSEGSALLVSGELHGQWIELGLVEPGLFLPGPRGLWAVEAARSELISSAELGPYPQGSQQMLAVARALSYTRRTMGDVALDHAIYLPQLPHLLPTEPVGTSSAARDQDNLTLGRWLTGGMNVPVTDGARMRTWAPGLSEAAYEEILGLFGWQESAPERIRTDATGGATAPAPHTKRTQRSGSELFSLPGRTELERFFRERIIDVIDREEDYRRMGIPFPGPTLLVGPPGCGKTFAVERLVEYLGWPSYVVNADSVASSYLHETSRLISRLFSEAMADAPCVIVMDELEAYLSERASTSHQYHVEEMAEFLRLIPQLPEHRVLLFGMTNVPERIDKAIMRKGRFDHVIEVGMPSQLELVSLLKSLLADVPVQHGLDLERVAARLKGRPISDVVYVVREAGRLAVVLGEERITDALMAQACDDLFGQAGQAKPRRVIGFG